MANTKKSKWVLRGVAAQRLGIAEYTLRTCKEYRGLPESAKRINEQGRSEVDYELLEAAWGVTHPQDDVGGDCRDRFLQRCHKLRGDLLQLELDIRRGSVVDVGDMNDRIGTLAALLREASYTLNERFGVDAAQIIDKVLADWAQKLESWQPQNAAE